MGKSDKVVRIVLAIICGALYFGNIVTGTWGVVLLIAMALLIITSFMDFCPIYAIFGYSTCNVEKNES